MLYRNLVVTFAFIASGAGIKTAAAQSQDYDVRPLAGQVTGDDLLAAFKGITHEGAYNFDIGGRPGMRYIERHAADGGVVYTEKGQSLKGQWTVTPRDTVCYTYESDEIGGGCFRVYQLGSCYYFYSASFIPRETLDQDYWTARSVKKGDRATCEDMIS